MPLRALRLMSFPALLLAGLAAWVAPTDAAAGSPPGCDYRITLSDAGARGLAVSADCRTQAPLELRPRTALLRRHLHDLTINGVAVELPDLFDWTVAPAGGRARFDYRFDLEGAAEASRSVEGARRFGRSVVAPLHSWLLGPADPAAVLSLVLDAPRGGSFLTGLPEAPDGSHRLVAEDLDFAGYALFGTFRSHELALPAAPQAPGQGGSRITLGLPDSPFALTDTELLRWVERSARLVSLHWGGMPTRRSLLVLVPEPEAAGVIFGRVRGGGGTTAYISLGADSGAGQLYESWELIHEMMHLGSPFIRDGFWFMEGFATYAEPIARTRAGWRSEAVTWEEFLHNMPRGLPALTGGQSAMARSADGREGAGVGPAGRSIESIYWGGALFMLLADVAIRVQSENRLGLMDCFLAVLEEGGDAAARWTLASALVPCNAATGGTAMADLYRRQIVEQRPLDLEALWRDLGVHPVPGGVLFDDAAPLAAIRRAITAPASGAAAPRDRRREG